MKRKRFSVEQIVAVVTQAELGMALADIARQVDIRSVRFTTGRSSTRGRSRISWVN